MYALVECNHARLFREAAKELLLVKLPRLHPLTWARDIISAPMFTRNDRVVIISVMYSIWPSRNKVMHGEAAFVPAKTMEDISDTLLTLEMPRDGDAPKVTRPSCKWRKPPDDTVKLNSDAAIRSENNLAATAIVARSSSCFLGAMDRAYEGILDPLIVEALALRDAAAFAVQKGFSKVLFEVDCADLVRHWQGRVDDRSVIKPVLDEISELCRFFVSYTIVHARREANRAAHSCPKFISI